MSLIIAIPTNNNGTFTETPTRSQNAAYCQYVKAAGFTPILVSMEADASVIADMADGLLLAGGIDIDPIYYGYSNQASVNVDPAKDAAERALLYAFIARNKRVFGICRGMQLIFREFINELANINSSAEAYFDYNENLGGHAQTSGLHVSRHVPSHYVSANMGQLLSADKSPPPEKLAVNSMHHQVCVFYHGKLAANTMKLKNGVEAPKSIDMREPSITSVKTDIGMFSTLAWSLRGVDMPKEVNKHSSYWSIIEAFSLISLNGTEMLAVQWHPEHLQSIDMLRNFFLKKSKSKPQKELVATS